MKDKVNIICLYWVGKFRGRDFGYKDIERLYQSVRKHIDRAFDFYVLTNDHEALQWTEHHKPTNMFVIPLHHNWPGWWSKMELHRPDLPKGRTLYMDLDSHAIRSLQPILDYPGDLVMFETGIHPRKWPRLEKSGWVCKYQAATMLFDSGTKCMTDVYERFCADPVKWMMRFRSDQDVMGEWLPNQPTFPRNWMCKLETVRSYAKPPEDVIIVTGQPPDGLFRKTGSIPWFEQMART